jgi:hypothetical protein
MTGYVYILSNPRMPGLLKVGSTTRHVQERVEELNSATGVPAPFTVEAYFPAWDPKKAESEIHAQFEAKRIKGREFFEADLSEVLHAASRVTKSGPTYVRREQGPGADAQWDCLGCGYVWRGFQKRRCSSTDVAIVAEFVE